MWGIPIGSSSLQKVTKLRRNFFFSPAFIVSEHEYVQEGLEVWVVQKKNSVAEQVSSEERRRVEEERQKLILQRVKLPNGATFTRLKPLGA